MVPVSPPSGLQSLEQRSAPPVEVPPGSLSRFRSFGVITRGLTTVGEAFQSLRQVFQVSPLPPPTPENASSSSPVVHLRDSRFSPRLLQRHPVDLLVVDNGDRNYSFVAKTEELWETAVSRVQGTSKAPAVVVESWIDSAAAWDSGPASKAWEHRWLALGYSSRAFLLASTEFGGSIAQTRLLVVRTLLSLPGSVTWPALDPAGVRPMANLLLPRGLLAQDPHHRFKPDLPRKLRASDPAREPMPWSNVGLLFACPDGKPRPLLPTEVGRGLGLSKPFLSSLHDHNLARATRLLLNTTSVYHWEFVSNALQPLLLPCPSPLPDVPAPSRSPPPPLSRPISPPSIPLPFGWEMQDISVGKPFWCEMVARLKAACAHYGDRSAQLEREGLEMLHVHRANYRDGAPDLKKLQLLWWAFPSAHWDEIRDGSSMNYLRPPSPMDTPNSPMDEDATAVAAEFIDELLGIGAMGPLPPGVDPQVIAPLFAVPKAGQPGQYRIIADFRRGTQNQFAGPDPVCLNRPTHILEQLYRGGWSAVVDASKYFYQFKTREDEWPYLCLRHPITGEVYTYYGLPMGASNSPALGGRFGLGFLRHVLERINGPPSSGAVENNTWWASFTATGEYHPDLGHGYLLRRADGGLPVHVWVHVDDFFIHAATEAECHRALGLFLDVAVEHGLLCHPGKLQLPSQRQKYVGFIFDTTDIPTLVIPDLKRDRAIAMVRYIRSRPLSHNFPTLLCLSSSVLWNPFPTRPPLRWATPTFAFSTTLFTRVNFSV